MDVLTPSAVDRSYHLGLDFVKLFPGSLGGVSNMKALQGPFPIIPIMLTGGVKLEDMKDRFAAGAFAVGGCTVPQSLGSRSSFFRYHQTDRNVYQRIAGRLEP